MVKTVLNQLGRNSKLRYVTDQVASVTFASDLAEVLLRLTRKRQVGLFHVANKGAISRFELACAVAVAAGSSANRVLPLTTSELLLPRVAARPAYSVLDCSKLVSVGEPAMRHFQEPLNELVGVLVSVL